MKIQKTIHSFLTTFFYFFLTNALLGNLLKEDTLVNKKNKKKIEGSHGEKLCGKALSNIIFLNVFSPIMHHFIYINHDLINF